MMNFSKTKLSRGFSKKRKTSDEYESFFKLNPQLMFIYSESTYKILDANSAVLEKYGYTRKEFLSMTVNDIRPAEDVSKLKEMFRNNKSDSRVTGYWRHRKKDGSIIFVEVYSHKINFPPYEHARLVTAFDVTKRKVAEDKLSRSEQRFRDLAELLPQIVFEINLEGKIQYCNKIAYDTFQYPYDTDLSTINIFEFVSPSQVELAKTNFSKLISGGMMEKIDTLL